MRLFAKASTFAKKPALWEQNIYSHATVAQAMKKTTCRF
jgi:hypothetical protein